ncbi:hypothetical protein, partial [Ligilactobacillus agilis]|uniref:hypothetical protein n=1 Tax=Ligilactobacillus agilis TaxID=1601 RepID=UPI003F8AF983
LNNLLLFHEKILLYYVHVSSIGGLGKYLHTSHYGVLTMIFGKDKMNSYLYRFLLLAVPLI